MPKAIIFDVDGTLVDSVGQHARAWVDALREFGCEVTFDQARRQIGKGGDELLPVFLSGEEIAGRGEALQARRGDILKQRYMPEIRAFPQVRALFERLRDDGVLVALASSAKTEELRIYTKLADIVGLTHVETCSDDAERSKPHPDIFQATLAKLGDHVRPQDALVIGDTPYDAEAAAKAGLRTVGLTCGGWTEAELRQAGCIAVYANPADLLANYAGSPLAGPTTA